MQVQLNIVFDPGDMDDLALRLEKIVTAAGAVIPIQRGSLAVTPETSGPSVTTPDARKEQMQQQAAKARAAKAAKAADKPVDVAGSMQQAPIDDVAGDAVVNGEDDTEDMGLTSPSMSPGEALDAALAIVRQAYSSGHVAEVKALQKEWNVAKFYDVPVDKGHAFYARVMKLAQGMGIQV